MLGLVVLPQRVALQVERRCVLLHELVHEERGIPHGVDPREEAAVEQEVAHRLIPIELLADALRWTMLVSKAADHCHVTTEVLMTRWEHLHPSERHYLRRATDDAHGH